MARSGWGESDRARRDSWARRAVVASALAAALVILVVVASVTLAGHPAGLSGGAGTVLGSWMAKKHSHDSNSGSGDGSGSGHRHGRKGSSDSGGSDSGGSDSGGSDSGGSDSGGSDSGGSDSASATAERTPDPGSGAADGAEGSVAAGPTGLASPPVGTGGGPMGSPGHTGSAGSVLGGGQAPGGQVPGGQASVGRASGGQVPGGAQASGGQAAVALPVPGDNGDVVTTRVLCTTSVASTDELLTVLRSAGPNDVICLRTPTGAGLGGVRSSGRSGGGPDVPASTPVPSSADTGAGIPGAGVSGGSVSSAPAAQPGGSGGPPGAGRPDQSNCTTQVANAGALGQALSDAAPGARICVTGNLAGQRLTINKGGSAQAPLSVIGNGKTTVKGISVDASNVVVDGFQVLGAAAPGIEIHGSNITVRNNTVDHPTGGDFDGLRFFGQNLRILHNTIMNINPDGGAAHADCMQTFATGSDSPASQHVLIDGNKCSKIDNQCLIAEGPHSSAGDGSGQGTSSDLTFSNNTCEVGASQATEIDDVQNVKIVHNLVTGTPDKAFSFQNKATGAVVAANKIASGIGYEVGMDTTSKAGYRGPKVGGGP